MFLSRSLRPANTRYLSIYPSELEQRSTLPFILRYCVRVFLQIPRLRQLFCI